MGARAHYLDGQFLIAMPGMDGGNFARAVIYVCAHSEDGAMGLIINKPLENISFQELLVQLDILPGKEGIVLPQKAATIKVHRGGPVETGRGFVLHTSDYHHDSSTLTINERISLTATVEILKAIAEGRGPRRALLALGYAGWGPGQLESEIQANGWLISAADPAILFESDLETRYTKALSTLGINPALFLSEGGRA